MFHFQLKRFCIMTFCLALASYARADIDYRHELELASETMATQTMSFCREFGMASQKNKTITLVLQKKMSQGQVYRYEEVLDQEQTWHREKVKAGEIIQRRYYTDEGHTQIFITSAATCGIRNPFPIPREKVLEHGLVSGKAAVFNGSPCWQIRQEGDFGDARKVEEYLIDQETHVIYSIKSFDGNGRRLHIRNNTRFNLNPQIDDSLFTLPNVAKMYYAKNIEEDLASRKKMLPELWPNTPRTLPHRSRRSWMQITIRLLVVFSILCFAGGATLHYCRKR